MGRKTKYSSLRVLINRTLIGHLSKESSGAIQFRYDENWLRFEQAFPVSLSLPLQENPYLGQPVATVFDNLLPDSDLMRRRVAEKVGAAGTDVYSLLCQIGRDCVGALQFIPAEVELPTASGIEGDLVNDDTIADILNNLVQEPLGLNPDDDFRISIAGAQEKTALLFHNGQWFKPRGTTPTTHIFKTKISNFPDSIDNEYYCLRLMAEFGLAVNEAKIEVFSGTRALVIERFDRKWTPNERLLRLPQEDFCQALSIPSGKKYQNEGGPGIVEILKLLGGGDTPAEDQKAFLKAQMLYWLMGATDGHAKNFSIFLGPSGRFRLTPFYDVLSAQPSLDTRKMERKQMKLAMFVGDSRHYSLEYIHGRHFIQTAERAKLPNGLAGTTLEEIRSEADRAFGAIEDRLPLEFPFALHDSVKAGFFKRLSNI